MPRGSVASHTRISTLLLGRFARNAASRLSLNTLAVSKLWPGRTDRLVIAPQDLRTTDATRAAEIYAGRFVFAGKIVTCNGRSPFDIEAPSDDWETALFGFGWLRHLRAADTAITRANARSLVDEWIARQNRSQAVAWRPEVLARRVMSLLSQAPLVLTDSDGRFYRRYLRNLTRETRYLRSTVREATDGVPRLQVLIALTYATLCLANQGNQIKNAARRLSEELARQILPDGGHVVAQSRRARRIAARFVAAAPDFCGEKYHAAAGAAQRHRPHDADAALFPPWRRHLRIVQRHGPDVLRPRRHHPGL